MMEVIGSQQNDRFGRRLRAQPGKKSDHQPAGKEMMRYNAAEDALARQERGKRPWCGIFHSLQINLRRIAPPGKVQLSRPGSRSGHEQAQRQSASERAHQCALPPESLRNCAYQLGDWTPFC